MCILAVLQSLASSRDSRCLCHVGAEAVQTPSSEIRCQCKAALSNHQHKAAVRARAEQLTTATCRGIVPRAPTAAPRANLAGGTPVKPHTKHRGPLNPTENRWIAPARSNKARWIHLAYIHTYIHTYMHTYIHTYIRMYVRTDIQTYIHTYMHTYMFTCFVVFILHFDDVWLYMFADVHVYLHVFTCTSYDLFYCN